MVEPAFEPVSRPRYRIVTERGVEHIVIPAARSWFVMLFLPVWLIFWTIGGIAAMGTAVSGEGGLFILIWLVFWAFGWFFAASWFAWNLAGTESLSIDGDALVQAWSLFGYRKRKRYDLAHVSGFASGTPPFPYGMMNVSYPPFMPMMPSVGPVKWNYGAKTIYAGAGLSEAEAAAAVEHLKVKLPARYR